MSYDLIDDAIWERLAPCFRRNGVAAGTGTVARKRRFTTVPFGGHPIRGMSPSENCSSLNDTSRVLMRIRCRCRGIICCHSHSLLCS